MLRRNRGRDKGHKNGCKKRECRRPFKFRFLNFQVLVDLNADPNRCNKFGMTPLHHASVGGDAGVVRQLIDAGARPNDAGKGENR
jgi:ankyrin repeat protein